jgi:general L-amino acid transport system ATP-binding protein
MPTCARPRAAGACWGVVTEKARFILLGRYPQAEQWRPILATFALVTPVLASCSTRFWKPWLVLIWAAGLAVFFVLMGGGVAGLSKVPTDLWGGLPLTVMLTVCRWCWPFRSSCWWRWAGAPACRPSGPLHRLHRTDPRCAADLRAVHGVLHVPAVHAGGQIARRVGAGVVGITLFAAAYMAEIVRGGLQTVGRGQAEAAASMGLTYWQAQRKIVLPQALATVVPGIVNNFISLFKDTSLVTIVSLYELTGALSLALGPTPTGGPSRSRPISSSRRSISPAAGPCRATACASKSAWRAARPAECAQGHCPHERPIIHFDKVNKWYSDDFHVLRDIDLSVQARRAHRDLRALGLGQIDADPLCQRTGGLPGGHADRRGTVLGDDVKAIDAVRRQVGMVFQQFNLFPHLTVLDNLTLAPTWVTGLPRREATERAMAQLERVRIADQAHKYPLQLSGGQQQRVAIARALCLTPKIMLFDEPTSALDPEMIKEVLDVIIALAEQGMTMLCVTHEMGFARAAANRIIFMDEGQIMEENTPAGFFDAPQTARGRDFLSKILGH